MSEQERIKLSEKISAGIRKAQRLMFERKAKLGQAVIVADADGNPKTISAIEALKTIPNEPICNK